MSLTSGLNDIAVLSVTRQGVALARRLEAALCPPDGSVRLTVYVTAKYAEDAPAHYVRFADKMQPVVDAAWAKHEALLFIGAAGIAVRMIAPHVLDKRYDPGVVVIDIQGKFAIALCSGHLGGANELARIIGETLGATPVVTTGTDVNETLAPDVLAKQLGADIENWDALKVVSGALVDGRRVGVLVEGVAVPGLERYVAKNVHVTTALDGFEAGIGVTARIVDTSVPTIWLRPRTLVVGIGCNSGTSAEEIEREVVAVLTEAALSPRSIREIATIELKKDEPGLVAFAAARKLPLRAFSVGQVNDAPPFARSEAVFRHVGVYGVAEPSAMLAAGADHCVVTKQKRGNVTVAVAMAPVTPAPSEPRPPTPKPRPVAENKERVGLVLVHTGDGKGKSTSSFGLALRAVGHGMKVHIVQFIKGSRAYGELDTLAKLGVVVQRAGEGFTWEVRSDERQRELATWGMARAAEAVAAGVDVLILDEVNITLGKGFLAMEPFLAFLRARPAGMHVVCTGRYAPETLVEAADLVTNHALVKHPFTRGIRAQPGVEF